MERLTGRNSLGEITSYNSKTDYTAGDKEIRNKLAYYEELEEEGRIVQMSCNISEGTLESSKAKDIQHYYQKLLKRSLTNEEIKILKCSYLQGLADGMNFLEAVIES